MKQSVCSYCGVGCKFEIKDGKLKALKSYPTNLGMSCAKGMSLSQSIDINRLDGVESRDSIQDEFKPSSYDEAISHIASCIKQTTPKKVGFYLSGQMLNEDYYVANKLAKGFVGTPNCDTNSRTCMASAVVGYKKSFGVDYVPVRMQDIDKANLLILIGANPAESHVVLFNRIKKAQKQGLKVVVIDPRETLTSLKADLHLAIKPNSDIELLNLLAKRLIEDGCVDSEFISKHSDGYKEYKKQILNLDSDKLLEATTLSQDEFEEFVSLWKSSPNIITAWTMGVNQSSQGVDKNLAINNLHIITGQIAKEGSGPFSLTGQPNAMGGREVGGLSTTLAVHLDYTPESIQKVSKFWQTSKLPSGVGLTAFEMIQEAYNGNIDVLIVSHTDPLYHLPNQNFIKKALSRIGLIVELNSYDNSQTSHYAHIRIGVKAFGEKEGTQTNLDRTLTRVEAFRDSNLPQEWEVFSDIAKALGYKEYFGYQSSQDVFEEYQLMCKLSYKQHLDIYKADYQKLKDEPFVWGEGLFDDVKFLTPNQKAKLHFVNNKHLSEKSDSSYPFVLLTGRIRDQWHSGSKTRHIPSLLKHKELEFVELNPKDAKELCVSEGDEVYIVSKRDKIKATVKLTNIKEKTIFVPISHLQINSLTPSIIDEVSKEPDYNHSAVYIAKSEELEA